MSTTVTISYTDWLSWVGGYEPTLKDIESTTINMVDAYGEAEGIVDGVQDFLNGTNYRLLLYRYALHLAIVQSGNCAVPALAALYTKYDVQKYSGILQSASDGSSSATKFLPAGIQGGDARTMLIWATSYGQKVEEVFEELKGIAITI